jgi:voltage-gated potassium channel
MSHTLGAVSDGTPRPTRASRLLLAAEVSLLIGAYFVVPITNESLALRLLFYGLGIALVVAITVRQLGREMRGADLSVRVDSLVIAIVLSTLIFSLSYVAIDDARPDEFDGLATRLDALYFSVSTTATVGFGDVHAVGQLARAIVTVQIVFNLVVLAAAASVLSRTLTARRRAAAR